MSTANDTSDGPMTPTRRLQAMLDVEVALAEAVAEVGLIPAASVAVIRAAADIVEFDVPAILAERESAGNVVIPLVRYLRQRVAQRDAAAAGHVHWGATSQDIDDTALVLLLGEQAVAVDQALVAAADAAADLACRHARTPMAGRTWLQQATPTTFGAKAAGWLDGIERVRARLIAAAEAAAVAQLGGAVGTQAGFGVHGPEVAATFARRLGLAVADVAWHTERSRIVDVACALGLVCGTAGKIGRDIALLTQTEVAEVAEASVTGRGGSSSMPHKRNPVSAIRCVSAAVKAPGLVATMLAAMPQELERAAGGWQAEWDTMSGLVAATREAAGAVADVLEGLTVDAARMRANLDAQGGVARAEGLANALAAHVGRDEAHRLVATACRRALSDGRPLVDVVTADPTIALHLDRQSIAHALDPVVFVAPARAVVERALRRWRPEMAKEPVDG